MGKTSSLELGKKDAEQFITRELIDYEPFVAMSDMHMVRKTIPLNYHALDETVSKLDSELWVKINDAAEEHAEKHGEAFSHDEYALGLTEGVAAVWEKIRDKI